MTTQHPSNTTDKLPKTDFSERLSALFPEIDFPQKVGSVEITGVAVDSRMVAPGDLFIAIKGGQANGQDFIPQAIENGAAAIAIEGDSHVKAGQVRFENKDDKTVSVIAVANLTERVSAIAGQCYGDPSSQMSVVGVTGTNGKSTCVSVIAQLHEKVKGKAATLGTLGVHTSAKQIENHGMTTPDAASCQRLLAKLCWEEQVALLAMEVSSHGLDQYRVAGVHFEVGLFTNLSHDHLDYHKTLEQYAAAKQKLFESTGMKAAVINLDDPFAPQMVAAAKQNTKVFTYSLLHFAADVYADDIQYSAQGVRFHLVTPWGEDFVESPLLGEFNVYNLIASIATLCALGISFEALLANVKSINSIPGRMQMLSYKNSDISVVVDYAHTPAALKHVIAATRVHTAGKLWLVFGCGGDRDRAKRPVMGGIAERFADYVVVTNDNPRTESAEQIAAEVLSGFVQSQPQVILDRAAAIEWAVQSASPGDVILLAGKGHENYQIIDGIKTEFDDAVQALEALRKRTESRADS